MTGLSPPASRAVDALVLVDERDPVDLVRVRHCAMPLSRIKNATTTDHVNTTTETSGWD